MNSTKLPPQPGRNVRNAVSSQLLLTHALTGAMIAIIVVRLPIDPNLFFISILLLALLSGLIGALLTANLQLSLEEVEKALEQLKKGHFSTPLALKKRYWPLNGLRDSLNVLNGQLNHHLSRAKQASEARSQWLAQISEAAAQEERNRLARDLHDSIKQQIFSISIGAATVQARWENDPPGALRALTEVRRIAREAMIEMNAMLQQLRPAPLEKVGLVAALREQCEALQYRSGATVVAALDDLPSDDRFPPGSQEALFRIAQEAFGNIARHARATHVGVRLYCQFAQGHDWLTLEVSDNGQGFDTTQQSGGMGLHNMQERVIDFDGRVEVRSKPASGTTVLAWIPLLEPEPEVIPQKPDPRVAPLKKRANITLVFILALAMLVAIILLMSGFSHSSNIFSVENSNQSTVVVLGVVTAVVMLTGYRYITRLKIRAVALLVDGSKVDLDFSLNQLQLRIIFCLFAALYLPYTLLGWYGWEWMSWIALVVCISFSLLGCYQILLHSRITSLQYHMLSPLEKREKLEKDWKAIKWETLTPLMFSINVVLTYSNMGGTNLFPASTQKDFTTGTTLLIFILMVFVYIINLLRVLEWRRGKPFEPNFYFVLKTLTALAIGIGFTALILLAFNSKFNLLYRVELGDNLLTNVAWSPDGKYLAGATDSNPQLIIWNASGQPKYRISLKGWNKGNIRESRIAWSNDSQKIAVTVGDTKVWLGNINGNLQTWLEGTAKFTSVAWSPDGTKIATVSDDKTIRLWDSEGKLLATLQGHTETIRTLAWSPNSQYLASGSDDSTIRIWTADGKEFRTLQGDNSQITAVTWSPDSRIIASSSNIPDPNERGSYFREWSLDGTKLLEKSFKTYESQDLRWSPDGRYIGLVSKDLFTSYNNSGYIILLTPEGSEVATYYKNHANFNKVSWSPDGKKLAVTKQYDEELLVWKVGH